MLKSAFAEWLFKTPKYIETSYKEIKHPIKKNLMSFNCLLTDSDKNYNIMSFENELNECFLTLSIEYKEENLPDFEETYFDRDFEIIRIHKAATNESFKKYNRWFKGEIIIDFDWLFN